MTPRRQRTLSIFPLVVIVGHLLVLALDVEAWPFSPYPMYSEVRSAWSGETVQVTGVTVDGTDIVLNENGFFGPYSNLWLMNLAEALQRRNIPTDDAMRALLRVYDDGRAAKRHDGPPLQRIRIERVTYDLVRETRAAPPITSRTVVVEFARANP